MEESLKQSLRLHDLSREIGIPDYVLAVYLSQAPIENCEDAYIGVVLNHKEVPTEHFVIFDDAHDVAYEFSDKYAKGGVTPFLKLANQVASQYEGKAVPSKYKKVYGERYSKKEAQEVGRKVAAKVYRKQQGERFAEGGNLPSRNKEIAQTILNQLGGINRLVAFTGAYNFVAINNGVSFKIKNAKANYIKITLNGKDLYDLEVGRIRGTTYKVVGKEYDLFYDMLKPVIERLTGMYLSFGDGGVVQLYGGYPLLLGGMQNSAPLSMGVENIAPVFADGGMVQGVSGYPLRLGGMQVNPLMTQNLVPIFEKGGQTHIPEQKHWNKYPKTKHGKAYIVSDSSAYNKDKYEAIFGDYDNDGIPNADDAEPLRPSEERVESVSLTEQFSNLLQKREISNEYLERFVERLKETTPINCTIYARTKTPYSIMKSLVDWKITEDGNNYEAGIKDLLGTTVAFDNISDLEEYRNKVMSGLLGEVIGYKDYYDNTKDGYRAYHFVVKFQDYPVEVQLKSKRMKEINEISHPLYKNKSLNKEFMLYLTSIANAADNGDKTSKSIYSKLLSDKKQLLTKLTK
jgi:ppGpp synthetase/RelA/SpoT-type nucleotidyltranferase